MIIRQLLFILFIGYTLSLSSQTYTDKKGNEQLWGEVNLSVLTEAPYNSWYEKNIKDYKTDLSRTDAKPFDEMTVKVFIGTWCGDTKYLLPKFMETWKSMGLSQDKLEVIALHNEDELYKQGPEGESKGFDIHKVPTFIFYKNGEEQGRIVERTVFDLDTDMQLIAKGRPYKHRYQGVPIVSELADSNPDSLTSESYLKKAIKKTRRELSTSTELYVYGFTLLYAGEVEKARFVFTINQSIFPHDPYTRYGFGKLRYMEADYEKARKSFTEAIRLKPDFDGAVKYLHESNLKIKEQKENG